MSPATETQNSLERLRFQIFRNKAASRHCVARLPVLEKMRRLEQMFDMTQGIRRVRRLRKERHRS